MACRPFLLFYMELNEPHPVSGRQEVAGGNRRRKPKVSETGVGARRGSSLSGTKALFLWRHQNLNLEFDSIPPRGYIYFYMKYMDENSKAKVVRRLKLLEGQVRGLQKMVQNDTYCIDVITQTSAVKQGLSNIEDMLLENHLGHCVFHQVRSGQTKKAKEEIIKVYKLKRK